MSKYKMHDGVRLKRAIPEISWPAGSEGTVVSTPPRSFNAPECLVEFCETVNGTHRSDLYTIKDEDLELVWKDPNGYEWDDY